MKLTIIGSGTSTGIPQIGCECPVCTSRNAKDKRLRCSGVLDVNNVRIQIDCGPDFREQMIRLNDFRPIDGVLITHEHYDHVGGLDDLRPYCAFRDVIVYGEDYTCERLRQRIPYCFATNLYPGVPHISLSELQPQKPFTITNLKGDSVEVLPIRVMHAKMPILGYRIGKMAWITDMTEMPSESFESLKGLDVLVMNALRIEEHISHQTLAQALERVKIIQPRRTYLVHMSHHMGLHDEVDATLPENVHLAYDGLCIDIED